MRINNSFPNTHNVSFFFLTFQFLLVYDIKYTNTKANRKKSREEKGNREVEVQKRRGGKKKKGIDF